MDRFFRFPVLCVCAPFLAGSLWAFPASPKAFTVDNDGDSLTLRNVGDEHYRYTETLDGYLVIRGEDGVYRYATEEGVAGTFNAKNSGGRSLEENAYLKGLRREKVQQAHFEKNPDRLTFPSDEKIERAPWVPTLDTSSAIFPVLKLPAASGHVKGTNRFPVLLVAGPDASNCDSSRFYAQVNQEGFGEDGHIGSVKDYFTAQSNGLFVKEAIENLLSKYSDFDAIRYDADGDGEVDALAVMYAGTKENANDLGGFAHYLQYNNVGMLDAGNGKKFNSYFILQQMDSETEITPMAQFVHEFSHTMGLKDHYCVSSGNCYKDYADSLYQAPGVHAWDGNRDV